MNKQQQLFANMGLSDIGAPTPSTAIPVPNAHLHPSMVAGSDPSNPVVGFGFGSPSSTTSSSPPLSNSPTIEQQQHAQLTAMMQGIMSNNNVAVSNGSGVQVASVPAVHCSGCKSNETVSIHADLKSTKFQRNYRQLRSVKTATRISVTTAQWPINSCTASQIIVLSVSLHLELALHHRQHRVRHQHLQLHHIKCHHLGENNHQIV